MLSPLAYWLILAVVALYAFVRGQLDERYAAGICVVATVGTLIFSSAFHERFHDVEVGILVVDLLALAGFTWIALRSDRFWPLWVAGLQLTTSLSHFLKMIDSDLIPSAYAVAGRFWVYPIFLIIVIGTWRGHRRRATESFDGALTG